MPSNIKGGRDRKQQNKLKSDLKKEYIKKCITKVLHFNNNFRLWDLRIKLDLTREILLRLVDFRQPVKTDQTPSGSIDLGVNQSVVN